MNMEEMTAYSGELPVSLERLGTSMWGAADKKGTDTGW